MHHFHFHQIFIVFSLNFLRIKSKENEEPIGPPIRSRPSEVIVHLRANSYNISAFVPNHPGGEAVLRLVNGQDIEQYIEGRKCVLGICHRHRYAYQVLRQFEMPSDVIVGVKGKFYNISAFVPDHPGGSFVLRAINGQQNVEQYLEGRKCVFGICHRHANAYEVLSQLEMSGLNTVAAAPSTVVPSTAVPPTVFPHTVIASPLSSFPSLGHFQNSSTSPLIVPHLPATKVKAQQKQLTQSLAKQSDKTNEKEETNEGKRNNRTELAFANDLPTQNETKTGKVLKQEQIGKEMKGKAKGKGKAPKRKNNETATEEKQRDGKGKRNGGKERTEAKEKEANSKKGNEKETKSEQKAKGEEEKRRKRAKSEQKKEKEVKPTDNQPENGQMLRGADARKRRVPLWEGDAKEKQWKEEEEGRQSGRESGRRRRRSRKREKKRSAAKKEEEEKKGKRKRKKEEEGGGRKMRKEKKKEEGEEKEGRRRRRKGKKKEEGEEEGREWEWG
ncbi:hypothetical protein niasHS_010519 [Heterodera schachtii]|uniref:Cytochrome b5 heme-binding domain-containing protein n=1 Tax=Heterodera schachtii TaxID=97005 RepID=A0ABD2IRV2_HETSC